MPFSNFYANNAMRVIVAEACDAVRHRLVELVSEQPGWALLGQMREVKQAVDFVLAARPDLLILGSRLIDGSNFEALRRLFPNQEQMNLIMLCDKLDGQYLYAARTHGVDYLLESPRDIELLPSLLRQLKLGKQRKQINAT